jgi:hypothetical protein
MFEVWQNLAPFYGRPIGSAVEVLLTKVIHWRLSVLPIVFFVAAVVRVQSILAKMHFTYNFKFLCRQYHAHPNQNSLRMVPRFCHRTCTMVKSPIKESNDGLPCKRHCEFISWKPMILKSPIGFNHPTLLIKPIMITGFHHPKPENTQARRVDNASRLKIANKQ